MTYVICAIAKNERRYVREWAEWHLARGFEHIYVFEDYGSESHADLFEDEPRVTVHTLESYGVKNHHSSGTQLALYNQFLSDCREHGTAEWVAYIDVDEFIDFTDGYDLHRLCSEHATDPGILLAWKCYNASGHIKRPDGPVTEAYTELAPPFATDPQTMWNIKSIAHVPYCNTMISVHHASGAVNTVGSFNIHGPLCYKKAWLRHYFSKSFEDYCDRMFTRGNLHNNYRSFDNFFRSNPDMMQHRDRLIASVRHRHCNSTMWISRELGIISGGNLGKLMQLEKTPVVNP